jgi:hypothetical protein
VEKPAPKPEMTIEDMEDRIRGAGADEQLGRLIRCDNEAELREFFAVLRAPSV